MSLLFHLHKVGAQCLCQEIKEFYERSSMRRRGSVGLWQVLVRVSDVSLREVHA